MPCGSMRVIEGQTCLPRRCGLFFKNRFGKEYNSTEDERRFQIFQAGLESVRLENEKRHPYTLGLNQFTDLTRGEYRSILLGASHMLRAHVENDGEDERDLRDSPASHFWFEKGAVPPVKNAGHCGSPWAMAATSAVESRWKIATKHLPSLSVQQLVDCSKQNSGCNGGRASLAIDYMQGADWLSEASYAYTARDGTCKHSGNVILPKGSITGYKHLPPNNAQALMSAVITGAVVVAVESAGFAFKSYSSGVLTANCGTNLDNQMLLVGYDRTGELPYWLVQNSWGASWGDQGFIKLSMKAGAEGMCGILMHTGYPTVSG